MTFKINSLDQPRPNPTPIYLNYLYVYMADFGLFDAPQRVLVRGAYLSTSALAVVLNAACSVSKLCAWSPGRCPQHLLQPKMCLSIYMCIQSAFAGITPCTLHTPAYGSSHESQSRACFASNQTSTEHLQTLLCMYANR